MAMTAGFNNAKTLLLLKPFSAVWARSYNRETGNKGAGERRGTEERSCWMPHPRTGIYFPRGQESVMDGIPSGAASLDCTVWFRGNDGVDDHKLDNHDSMFNSPHSPKL